MRALHALTQVFTAEFAIRRRFWPCWKCFVMILSFTSGVQSQTT